MSDPAAGSRGSLTITAPLIEAVCGRLAGNQRVRRTLPNRGRLHIDRQLPFLCVYRRPAGGREVGTESLVTSEAAYLIASGRKRDQAGVSALVEAVVATLAPEFGAFLIVEIWTSGWDPKTVPLPAVPAAMKPQFKVHRPPENGLEPILGTLETALARVRTARQSAEVEQVEAARCWPKGSGPLISPQIAERLNVAEIGIQIRPVFRNPRTDELYPMVLREMERGLTRALRRTFYKFACSSTTHCPVHYHVLGRRAMVKAVWEVDRQLAAVSDAFDFLLQVTPINANRAWQSFRKSRFKKIPAFHYRPLPLDPVLLKRRLYGVPLEKVEDPALWQLFREKQDELDRRLTMLLDIGTPRFRQGSLQVYGDVDNKQLRLAKDLLKMLPPRSRDDSRAGYVDAAAFRRRAEQEIEYYRQQLPAMKSRVQIRPDIAGLMVSRGSLLVAEDSHIPASRVDALLAHEVGTHVLTYYNGRAQPFRQLYSGLAGYEPLQEGLAVLAEYLVGGLSRPRLRLLAARVVAARLMIDGATFVEAFRRLREDYRIEQRTAYMTIMRAYRGGGMTKDAVYLRGLVQLLEYLAGGGKIYPLLVGKIAVNHVPIIRELQWRKVLEQAPLRPRYLDWPGAAERLARVRSGLTLIQLIERKRK